MIRFALTLTLFGLVAGSVFAAPIKALIIDGQNNHKWNETTPVLEQHLRDTGLFEVDVATSPPEGESQRDFNPAFSEYDVVVLNYNGDLWNRKTREAFVDYVSGGGGLVVVHAANNAFGQWEEYNEIIGIGGWGGRNKESGPYVFMKDWKLVHDFKSDGPGGGHEGYDKIVVDTILPEHPIMAGMPASWYTYDELYNFLRGPGENMTVLATAHSAQPRNKGGSGRHEPMIFTLTYGDGSIFHTTLGHDVRSMRGKGFEVTFTRGTQWAATGEVTIPIPDNIPRPLAPHEAVGELSEKDSYHPVHEVLAELALLVDDPPALAQVEARLIGYLEDPETPFLALQATCNTLGILGSEAAVPALSALLQKDAKHASIALRALATIDSPEATDALLDALEEDDAFNRVPIMNTLGRRRDAAAIPALSGIAVGGAQDAARTAIDALARIGTPEALTALKGLPESAETTAALIACAFQLVEEGNPDLAAAVFGSLQQETALPKHHRTASLRGLLLVDSDEGMQRVWEMLGRESESAIALNVLGTVPGSASMAKDILAHFDGLAVETQIALAAILGKMGQPEARDRMLALAQADTEPALRLAAIEALGGIPGNATSVQFLCALATDKDSPHRKAAEESLKYTSGTKAEDAIIEGIRSAEKSQREQFMKTAEARSLTRACPALLEAADDEDLDIRRAAFNVLRQLAGAEEYKTLIRLAVDTPEKVRGSAVRAVQYAGREIDEAASRVDPIAQAMKQGDDAVKVALMPILADVSSDGALAVVEDYAESGTDAVQVAAFAALGDWSNAAALVSVLQLARETNVSEHRVLLMDAFGDVIDDAKDLPEEDMLQSSRDALALGLDASGKRALLRALTKVNSAGALAIVLEIAEDPEVADDAKLAELTIKNDLMGDPILSASHNRADLANALDGLPDSRWSTNRGMEPGMWFGIDIRMPSKIHKVILEHTNSQNDYPRGYEVYVGKEEIDIETATPVLTGVGQVNVTTLEFDPPVEGRYIKIVQTGVEGLFWSIHELTVLHDPGFDSIPLPRVELTKLLEGDGFINQWNVSGPYMKEGLEGGALFDLRFGPELGESLATWIPLDAEVITGGIVDLQKLFDGDHRAAYLVTNVVAEAAKEVTLGVGSDDSIKVWHNGELVLAHEAVRPVGVDSNVLTLRLNKGDNEIMLKVIDLSGNWGACARIFERS